MAEVHGLTGEYFNNADLTDRALTRVDAGVNFDWRAGAPAAGVEPDTFSVRWTGALEVAAGGTYTFHTRASDGVRLWVGDRLVIDRWRNSPLNETSNDR